MMNNALECMLEFNEKYYFYRRFSLTVVYHFWIEIVEVLVLSISSNCHAVLICLTHHTFFIRGSIEPFSI